MNVCVCVVMYPLQRYPRMLVESQDGMRVAPKPGCNGGQVSRKNVTPSWWSLASFNKVHENEWLEPQNGGGFKMKGALLGSGR